MENIVLVGSRGFAWEVQWLIEGCNRVQKSGIY